MKLFSHEVAQKQWASVDYRKNISLIGMLQRRGHKEIVAIGSYASADKDMAEVAFVVREDMQGMGIATYLLGILETIARENDYKGFEATVLRENKSMIHVFKKKYPNAKISNSGGGEVMLQMKFEFCDTDPNAGDYRKTSCELIEPK
jgi:GNAT superfamily N-acetyltransferase